MSPREIHALKRGIVIAVVILIVIFAITVLVTFQVSAELDPGYPYS